MADERRNEWVEGMLEESEDPRLKRAVIDLHPLIGTDEVWVGTVAELLERLQESDQDKVVLLIASER